MPDYWDSLSDREKALVTDFKEVDKRRGFATELDMVAQHHDDVDLRRLSEVAAADADRAVETLFREVRQLADSRPSEDPVPPVGQTPPDPPRGDQVRRVTPEERKALGPGRDVWVKKRLRPDGPTKYYGLKPKRAYMEYDPANRQPIDDWQFVPSSDPVPTTQVREEDTRVSSGRSPIWYLLLGIAAFIFAFLAISWYQNGGLNDLKRQVQQIDWNPLDNEDKDSRLDSAARQQLNDARKRLASFEAKDAELQKQIDDLEKEVADMKARLDSGEIVYQDEIVRLEARVKTLEDHAIIVAPCPPGWEHMTSEELSAITGGACGAEIEP